MAGLPLRFQPIDATHAFDTANRSYPLDDPLTSDEKSVNSTYTHPSKSQGLRLVLRRKFRSCSTPTVLSLKTCQLSGEGSVGGETIVSIVAIVVSGAVGISGVILSLKKLWESDSIERASRRTMALQMLSDEELALSQVETECLSIELLVGANKESLGSAYENLREESARIVKESEVLLEQVRQKRIDVGKRIQDLRPDEIEAVIAEAYHGRMLAEAQLGRTSRSREDTIRIYLARVFHECSDPHPW